MAGGGRGDGGKFLDVKPLVYTAGGFGRLCPGRRERVSHAMRVRLRRAAGWVKECDWLCAAKCGSRRPRRRI